jgi:hypothetical protein
LIASYQNKNCFAGHYFIIYSKEKRRKISFSDSSKEERKKQGMNLDVISS